MVQTIDGKFKEKWQFVETEFEDIKKNKLLPFVFTNSEDKQEELKKETIEQILKNLKEKKFTVSVCGVVKAGKSTFLNSLFFGKNVLPVFDTPLTAKLTFIEYTDSKKDYFTATFYTEKEWQELNENLRKNDKEQYEQLNARIEVSESKQVTKEELFSTTTSEQYNLEDLKYYVSDPLADPETEDGKYTPFVKYVNVYINNENIKNIRIVDTPGLNDSNIINSKETIKWIGNTHALIFLLKNKGIDSSELQFFTAHLSQTKPENRIFVINKIDDISAEDANAVVAHLRDLGKSENYKQKGDLFGAREAICKYSGLISLLQKKFNSGLTLDEDEQYHFEGKENFNPDPDNILDKISTKLFNNEGKIRFDSGVKTVSNIYETMITEFTHQKIKKEQSLKNYNKDLAELERELEKEKAIQTELEGKQDETKENLKVELVKIVAEMDTKMHDKLEKLETNINFHKYNSLSSLKEELPYDFNRIFGKEFSPNGNIAVLFFNFSKKINDCLKVKINEIKRVYQQHGIENTIIFNRLDAVNNLDADFNNAVKDAFKELLDEKLPAWWGTNIFTFHNTNINTAKGVFDFIINAIEDKINILVTGIKEQASKCIDSNYEFIAEQNNQSIHEKIDLQKKDQKAKEEQKNKLTADIKELEKQINKIKQKQKEFKKQCERL